MAFTSNWSDWVDWSGRTAGLITDLYGSVTTASWSDTQSKIWLFNMVETVINPQLKQTHGITVTYDMVEPITFSESIHGFIIPSLAHSILHWSPQQRTSVGKFVDFVLELILSLVSHPDISAVRKSELTVSFTLKDKRFDLELSSNTTTWHVVKKSCFDNSDEIISANIFCFVKDFVRKNHLLFVDPPADLIIQNMFKIVRNQLALLLVEMAYVICPTDESIAYSLAVTKQNQTIIFKFDYALAKWILYAKFNKNISTTIPHTNLWLNSDIAACTIRLAIETLEKSIAYQKN